MNTLKYNIDRIAHSDEPMRILIVDDDLDMLMSLKDLLELEEDKYIIETVSNFDDALLCADSFKPDIAILDIKLGTKNGIDLVKPLKQKIEHIACIMITAYRGTEYTINALRAGVDDFIYKPVEPEHLMATIDRFQKTQNLLREKIISDQRFRALFDQSHEFLFILDPTGKIINVNNTALDSIGIKKEQLLDRHFFDIEWWKDDGKNKQKVSDSIHKVLNNEKTRVELIVNDSLNQECIIDFSIKPVIDNNNNTIMIIPEGRDITQNVKNELEIIDLNKNLEKRIAERTQELENSRDEAIQANSAKDIFLSQMSHELRTPMNAILGFTQILELDKDLLQEEQIGHIQQIHHAADHLMLLIDRILHLSQLGSTKYAITLTDFDINFSIEHAISSLAPLLSDKHIALHNNMEKLSGIIVTADIEALQSVLLKIFSNAIKYNHINGSVTINSELINKDFLKISITDTGVGIAEDKFEHVFKPFEQANENDFSSGMGIGLTICKKAMDAMSGDIGFSSKIGEGSTFWITLPLAKDFQE